MIGLDTSHVSIFAVLLHRHQAEDSSSCLRGITIGCAFPGGSSRMELSYSRVDRYEGELIREYGVTMLSSIEAVAEAADVIMIESVDGSTHLEQFSKVAPYGKPVFIDKPIATCLTDARAIVALAERYRVPLMSASSLRYASALTESLEHTGHGDVIGADVYGPMPFVQGQADYFWYGIHTVEMLFAIMGQGCRQVHTTCSGNHEVITGTWADGRIGVVRGRRQGGSFGAVIHRERRSDHVGIQPGGKPYYESLLEQVVYFFRGGISPVAPEETLAVISFIEAAHRSKETGKPYDLQAPGDAFR
ncbi:Gfo/Idh/MocA family oxidoreductase [Paenibacillus woosongensis]|uniref:Gfo/Idh/MocA family oxidoreductase n=1 Tax=Paenibacillus woosongensis TaxID=307580 RepID=A0AA95HZW2_9BACL|nr:Gfo/Idh/MocA family oxidoreductase [Paenibacillus woosongensis]WHX47130.1 Gfo/Idh/MocA family oxidoreductase [Paenibacillus woosongensis]